MWLNFVWSDDRQQDITNWGSVALYLFDKDRIKRVLLGGGREEGRHEVARSTTYKCVCARVFLVILTFEDFPPK